LYLSTDAASGVLENLLKLTGFHQFFRYSAPVPNRYLLGCR